MWGTGELRTGFWRGNLRERENMEDLDVSERVVLKLFLKKSFGSRDLD